MKKLFLSILTVVFLFAACDKEMLIEPNTTNNEVELTNTSVMGKKAPSIGIAPCNCDFITETTTASPWNGAQIADVNFDGNIDVFDIVILQTLIINYDTDNDGILEGYEMAPMTALPEYDYAQDGDPHSVSDAIAALAIFNKLKQISPTLSDLDIDDLECIQDYLLGRFDCP